MIALLCKALRLGHTHEAAEGFNDLHDCLTFLTTTCPEDPVFWRFLGDSFFDQKMYSEASNAYDMFAWNYHSTKKGSTDTEVAKYLGVTCWVCLYSILGFHYRCRKNCMSWPFCPNCAQRNNCIGGTPHDMLQIPSRWPQSEPEVDGSTTS
jgi:hypothetical protein